MFVVVTVPLSLGCIWAHLDNYVCPELQVHVLRILWMKMMSSELSLSRGGLVKTISLHSVKCSQAINIII